MSALKATLEQMLEAMTPEERKFYHASKLAEAMCKIDPGLWFVQLDNDSCVKITKHKSGDNRRMATGVWTETPLPRHKTETSPCKAVSHSRKKTERTNMNEIVNITGGQALTMSSREMAELCDKRHDNVMRTIESLVERGIIQLPQIEEVKNHLGQTVKEYQVNKRDSYVVVAQLSPEFTARLVDRWQELESQGGFKVPTNITEALRLAADMSEQMENAKAALQIAAPKTRFYDEFMNAEGLFGLQNAGRALKCKPGLFTRWLKMEFLFLQGSAPIPRARFIQMGLFEVKSEMVGDKARPQAFVTPKGLQYLSERVPANILIRQEKAA